jgi:hypothetical protein
VWVTAASTLFAGSPHFICRCPNGNIKPFCLGFKCSGLGVGSDKGCCCGSCSDNCSCKTPSAPAVRKGCCCHHKKQADESEPAPSRQVSNPCCTKVVTSSTLNVASQRNLQRFAEVVSELVPPPVAAKLVSTADGNTRDAGWHGQEWPPPVDLIITLQHFVI